MALNDPGDRKRLGPPNPGSSLPALQDRSKIQAAIARGRAAIADRQPPSTPVSSPPPPALRPAPPPPVVAPRVEVVRLQAFCCMHGRSNIILAERRGDTLRFVGNEPNTGVGSGGKPPALLSDSYRIEMNDWSCPHCATGGFFWLCNCEKFLGVLHCDGNRDGVYQCACGKREERSFSVAEKFEVRGRSGGSGSGDGSAPQRGIVPAPRR